MCMEASVCVCVFVCSMSAVRMRAAKRLWQASHLFVYMDVCMHS